MELLKTDLHKMIGTSGLPSEVCARLLSHVTSGLRYLHNRRLVHLDVKPQNIFVSSGVAKLGDFGLCCKKEKANLGGVCGTLQYLPGDVLCGKVPMSERNDIWGLGCVLQLCNEFKICLKVLIQFCCVGFVLL